MVDRNLDSLDTSQGKGGVVCQLHILENPVRVFPLEDFERDWNTG